MDRAPPRSGPSQITAGGGLRRVACHTGVLARCI
jgi:hypothetical protein